MSVDRGDGRPKPGLLLRVVTHSVTANHSSGQLKKQGTGKKVNSLQEAGQCGGVGQDTQTLSTVEALGLGADAISSRLGVRLHIVENNADLADHFAELMLRDYQDVLASGKSSVSFIIPVGPVGQYEILAKKCRDSGTSPASICSSWMNI